MYGGAVSDRVGTQYVGGLIVSSIGITLAGLSLWYLIVVRSLFFEEITATSGGVVLAVLEVGLLAGFSIVLVYGGYWLVRSSFEIHRIWWAGLWTLIGLAGTTVIVLVAIANQFLQGHLPPEQALVPTMLLAAGGGAFAGLLIGISTISKATEAERASRHHETLLFVNRLLRHNILNGMQAVKGNAVVLEDHVDEDGELPLETIQDRSERIVDLVENVRILMTSLSGETSLRTVDLTASLEGVVETIDTTYPEVTVDATLPQNVVVVADELLDAVFENVLENAIEHNDADRPRLTIRTDVRADSVRIRIADNGPGIPPEKRDWYLQAGQHDEENVGQGLGLYLVVKLVDRYGGGVDITDNDPRGTVVSVELQRGDDATHLSGP